MSNLCKKCKTKLIYEHCDNYDCIYSHWPQEATEEDFKNLSKEEIEDKYCVNMMNQCYLKDSTAQCKERVLLYFKEKYGFVFKIEKLEAVFSEYKSNTWYAFDKYYDIKKNGVKTLDTADREWIWEHLWVRVMGTELPTCYTQEEFDNIYEQLITKLEKPDWINSLYSSRDVYKYQQKRQMYLTSAKFDINGYDFPEHVKLEGLSVVNEAILEFLEENREEVEQKIKLKLEEQKNRKNDD